MYQLITSVPALTLSHSTCYGYEISFVFLAEYIIYASIEFLFSLSVMMGVIYIGQGSLSTNYKLVSQTYHQNLCRHFNCWVAVLFRAELRLIGIQKTDSLMC